MLRNPRLILLLFGLTAFVGGNLAFAQQQTPHRPLKQKKHYTDGAADKPIAKPRAATSCAEFGAGFTKLPGSDTCVRIGGNVSVEAGGRF